MSSTAFTAAAVDISLCSAFYRCMREWWFILLLVPADVRAQTFTTGIHAGDYRAAASLGVRMTGENCMPKEAPRHIAEHQGAAIAIPPSLTIMSEAVIMQREVHVL